MVRIVFDVFSKISLQLSFAIANVLAWLFNHMVGYRRDIVRGNIQRSFPNFSEKRIQQVANDFYRHFFQMMFEMLKSKRFGKDDWNERVQLTNLELLNDHLESGQSVIILTGHIANWEWSGAAVNAHIEQPVTVLYKKLKVNHFSKEIMTIREKGGVRLVEKDSAFRYLVKTKHEQKVIGMISDQLPAKGTEKYWMSFLNQETAFYTGAEKLAKTLKYPVLYADMRKTKPGYYEMSFLEIFNGQETLKEGELTKRYAHQLEATIRSRPSDYLWSHRRWKYSREQIDALPEY